MSTFTHGLAHVSDLGSDLAVGKSGPGLALGKTGTVYELFVLTHYLTGSLSNRLTI